MPDIPRDTAFDALLPFSRDPYRYIPRRCRELHTDLFRFRFALQSGICMTGPAAAGLFYDETRFKRRGAAPRRFQKTLFGQGGVQNLDGDVHRHRKRMFMSLVTPDRVAHLGRLSGELWEGYARKWESQDRVVLYDEVRELLTRAVCAWAEVPLSDDDVPAMTRELTALFDYASSIGPKHWWSRIARRLQERQMSRLIENCRAGQLPVSEESALHVIAHHRQLDGELLGSRIAAVELLNVLRPTVAVSVYITFAALSLHNYPQVHQPLRNDPDNYPLLFVQEVRRFYPFFPVVGAETRHAFEWNGYDFSQGVPVVLSLYGTNHDERAWSEPYEFRPERFRNWEGNGSTFIPQGGGDPHVNHRCPGEPIAVELTKVAAQFLTERITYDVPPQNLELDFRRLPALPQSRFIISNIRCST